VTLIVCPLQDVSVELQRSKPARLISLLAPGQPEPDAPSDIPRLTLHFHDIARPTEGLIAPDAAMVADLIAFGAAWTEPGPMLVHCWMGISRSTAAAMVLACALDPARSEDDAGQALRHGSPSATPNPLVIALADTLLHRGGRLIASATMIGRGAEASYGARFSLRVRPV
jgi:predicted protein tyrosine phosphatase